MKRMLNRNKQEIYYALFKELEIIRNPAGHEIGRRPVYHNPVRAMVRVTPARGEADVEIFGIALIYDKVMQYGKGKLPIDETAVLFVDRMPVIENDGSTETRHDYTVTRIATDINYTTVAISKTAT